MIIGGFSGPERGANKKIPFQVSRLSPARAPIQAKRTIGVSGSRRFHPRSPYRRDRAGVPSVTLRAALPAPPLLKYADKPHFPGPGATNGAGSGPG